ncbi:hypothetical protein G647_00003 [Cladophialophora carrionii CBS 160.54]|uniref:Glycosyltransferase family 28 N-terminal domain-containing protein n=1 Tax=Cladophialophora carrionii CBS 160.54 TaxID=1279043 RepID=V9DKY0_9EURO|nr:uncharacterized protein G647_00003 [Cladophialophora carrionii CBS 160.54]ETI27554.1 hypothetical protein G647_00003 [Cladophialophora carrionii CBS 160.54]
MGKEKAPARRPPAGAIPRRPTNPIIQTDNLPATNEPDSPLPEALLDDTTDILDDGRVSLNLDSKLAQVFAQLIQMNDEEPPPSPPPAYTDVPDLESWGLPLNIVIQVVGSKGDVQPFLALGTELQKYGHTVRLATHSVFKEFVESAGLGFYSIGGDPAQLMAYMVKNPGLLPRIEALRQGGFSKNKAMIREILDGCWASCISPSEDGAPFVANAIIANPPSFAHVHCAQALGIPLHIMCNMPWTPTRAFPHPLANISTKSTDPKLANYISYGMIQLLTWNGIGDIVQKWRATLDLEPLPLSEAPFLMETLQIPCTYCCSPALVPKPRDWAKHIDVCGFLLRDPPHYDPAPELEAFLEAEPPPIYIGFGSNAVDISDGFVIAVLNAIKECGLRAIISKISGRLARIEYDEDIFWLDDCPHEWLFQRVSVVVHHGGSATTACGLLNARPTIIVPFFGDQAFWGNMVARNGVGPRPIPYRRLTTRKLSEALQYCMSSAAKEAAAFIAAKMQAELGVKAAVQSFHRHLPADFMGCDLIVDLPATWIYTKSRTDIKISGAAAEILIQSRRIKAEDLQLYKSKPIIIENRRWDFLTSSLSVSMGVSYDIIASLSGFWRNPQRFRERQDKQRALARGSSQASSSRLDGEEEKSSGKDIAKMVGASAMSIPHFTGVAVKGFVVDLPVAVAEGFRNTPKLYGENVPSHAPVTDWKSGFTVAGKTFAHQMAEGLTDLLVQPVKGAARGGVVGFSKGIGKGALQTLTKPTAACMGLVGYTGQGIYKSLYAAVHSQTKNSVASARRVQDKYFIRANGAEIAAALVHRFNYTIKNNDQRFQPDGAIITDYPK